MMKVIKQGALFIATQDGITVQALTLKQALKELAFRVAQKIINERLNANKKLNEEN